MRPRALVVEDSLTVRMDLRAALSTTGFMVTTCSTLGSAQKWLDSGAFDLAILDILLPDGSGIDLLKHIKETARLRSTRVIMLSTQAEVSPRIQGLRLGADRYVGKPYDREYLMRTARELLKISHANEMLPSHRSANRRKKLLLVDDSPTFINALAAVLRQDGYEVAMAYSGEAAIELLTIEYFDGVLIDLVLPGIDGVETCRRLRVMKEMDQTLILLMTASANRINRAKALATGADELILKSANTCMLSTQLLCLFITRRQPSLSGTLAPMPELSGPLDASAQKAALLYQSVIAASGLNERIAKPLINRTFDRLGIDPSMLTPASLAPALRHIQETVRTFLPADESTERMANIAALAGVPAGAGR